jgi:hypothetical protein
MSLRVFHVDAFTARPFAGNPATVCPLAAWLDDALLCAVAAENNLSETASSSGAALKKLGWKQPWILGGAALQRCIRSFRFNVCFSR